MSSTHPLKIRTCKCPCMKLGYEKLPAKFKCPILCGITVASGNVRFCKTMTQPKPCLMQVEAGKLLDDFLSDVQDNFRSLSSSTSAHDCLLSPTRIATTACQYYFLFMGRLSRSEKGRKALDKHHILKRFVSMKFKTIVRI